MNEEVSPPTAGSSKFWGSIQIPSGKSFLEIFADVTWMFDPTFMNSSLARFLWMGARSFALVLLKFALLSFVNNGVY